MKRDGLESKAWYRAVKVTYLGAYGLAILAVLFFAYLGFPKEVVEDDRSVLVCNNGQRYPATTGGLYITYNNTISDWDTAYKLCNNNQPPPPVPKYPDSLKPNYDLDLSYKLSPSWFDFIKDLLIAFGVIFIVMEILKRVFLYIVVGKFNQNDE